MFNIIPKTFAIYIFMFNPLSYQLVELSFRKFSCYVNKQIGGDWKAYVHYITLQTLMFNEHHMFLLGFMFFLHRDVQHPVCPSDLLFKSFQRESIIFPRLCYFFHHHYNFKLFWKVLIRLLQRMDQSANWCTYMLRHGFIIH